MTGQLADLLSFRAERNPFEAYPAMLAGWELTRDGTRPAPAPARQGPGREHLRAAVPPLSRP